MVMVFLSTLTTLDIGGANKGALQAVLTKYAESAEPPEDLLDIGICRLESARDDKITKLVVGMAHYPHRALILRCMEQAGFKSTEGTAPAGWMETEIGAWIASLDS